MPIDEEPTVESRRIYEGRIINVREDTVRLASGKLARREIVEHGEVICVVPVDDSGNVLLVEQYRKAAGQRLLEVAAGGIEEGESPEQATLRELQEEVGVTAGKLQYLSTFWLTPGFSTEKMHGFLATDLRPSRLKPDADEDVRVVSVPMEKVFDYIKDLRICDAKSIAMLLWVLKLRG